MKNGLTFKRILLFLMFCTFMIPWTKAQPSLAFYPLKNQFNSFDSNPAFLTSREKFTFSIFPLAGTSFEYNNQEIVKSISSKFLKGSLTIQDYKDAFNKVTNQTSFHQNLESTLLSFTYHSDIGFFNFRVKDSEYFLATVQGDIFKFIFKSNVQSAIIGQSQSIPIQAAHYREYSLGYAYQSHHHKFTAGIRAKLYFGKSALFAKISGSIQNVPPGYALNTSGSINVSFPLNAIYKTNDKSNNFNLNSSQITKYLFNSGNPGMGVDLGINYHLMPDLTISMSIIDLGKIKWKSNVNSTSLKESNQLPNSSYELTPVGGVPTITKNGDQTYYNTFDYSTLVFDSTSFSKPLPTCLFAGIKYQVNPGLTMDITDRYVAVKDLGYNSLFVTASVQINKRLSMSSGYAMIADSYFNIPLALLYQGNFGQLFLGTDNLTAIVYSPYAEFAGVSFGACFYLFTNRNLSRNASDYTPFYRPRKIIKNHKTGLIMNENNDL